MIDQVRPCLRMRIPSLADVEGLGEAAFEQTRIRPGYAGPTEGPSQVKMVAGNEDAKRPGAIVPFTLKSSSNSFELAPGERILLVVVGCGHNLTLSTRLAALSMVCPRARSSTQPDTDQCAIADALVQMAAALAFIVRIRYLSWLSLYLAIIGIVSQKTSSSSNAWQGLMLCGHPALVYVPNLRTLTDRALSLSLCVSLLSLSAR